MSFTKTNKHIQEQQQESMNQIHTYAMQGMNGAQQNL